VLYFHSSLPPTSIPHLPLVYLLHLHHIYPTNTFTIHTGTTHIYTTSMSPALLPYIYTTSISSSTFTTHINYIYATITFTTHINYIYATITFTTHINYIYFLHHFYHVYIYITHLYYIYASIIYTTFIQQTHIAHICTAHIPSTHVPPTYLPHMCHTEPRHRVANISYIHICTTFSCEMFTITIITWITLRNVCVSDVYWYVPSSTNRRHPYGSKLCFPIFSCTPVFIRQIKYLHKILSKAKHYRG
jgi:hypothetical protein